MFECLETIWLNDFSEICFLKGKQYELYNDNPFTLIDEADVPHQVDEWEHKFKKYEKAR